MADKVQKILEEVVRLHNLLPVMDGDNISVNYADRICTALKMYIDSLQKESKKEAVIEVEKIMAEVDVKFPKFAKEVGDIHSCDPHFGVNIEEYKDPNFGVNMKTNKSVWKDASETPVASKDKVVLYTNGKWDLFKAYESLDDYDNYWSSVNQSLAEKGIFVKQWAYTADLIKL